MWRLVVVLLGLSLGARAQVADRVCVPVQPPGGRPFACTAAQFDVVERERARQQELMTRAAEAERNHARALAAQREPAAVAAAHPNPCGRPEYAGRIIEQANVARGQHFIRNRVVDIAAVTTRRFDPASRDMECQGTFVTAEGKRVSGVLELRRNAAGEPIAIFTPAR